jgi:hypothetical protein
MNQSETEAAGRMECWQCGEPEGVGGAGDDGAVQAVQIAVCHHCGKPLCQDHWKFISDPQLGRESEVHPHKAYHCEECRKAHDGPRAV